MPADYEHPFTGTPQIKTIWSWREMGYVEVVAVDLGRQPPEDAHTGYEQIGPPDDPFDGPAPLPKHYTPSRPTGRRINASPYPDLIAEVLRRDGPCTARHISEQVHPPAGPSLIQTYLRRHENDRWVIAGRATVKNATNKRQHQVALWAMIESS